MEILVSKDKDTGSSHSGSTAGFTRHAARLSLVAGLILLVGVGIDLGTLWLLQRQSTVQWEFVALSTTTNAYPMLVLSALLFYGYLVLGQKQSLAGYRVVAALVLALGVMGLAVLLLIVTNYFALMKQGGLQPEAIPFFRSVMIKSGGLSALFALCLLPLGVLGFRLPKATR